MQTKDYLEMLEKQISETENQSSLFGDVSLVNSKLISQLVEELKSARKVVEAASHIHWSCTIRKSERLSDALLELLHNRLKELEGREK